MLNIESVVFTWKIMRKKVCFWCCYKMKHCRSFVINIEDITNISSWYTLHLLWNIFQHLMTSALRFCFVFDVVTKWNIAGRRHRLIGWLLWKLTDRLMGDCLIIERRFLVLRFFISESIIVCIVLGIRTDKLNTFIIWINYLNKLFFDVINML